MGLGDGAMVRVNPTWTWDPWTLDPTWGLASQGPRDGPCETGHEDEHGSRTVQGRSMGS